MGSRSSFFQAVCEAFSPGRTLDLILVTHVLPDRLALIPALSIAGYKPTVLSVPYSTDENVSAELVAGGISVLRPSLENLRSPEYLLRILRDVHPEGDLLIWDIGGYFADLVQRMHVDLGERFLGIIEDTEQGLRRYESRATPVPVVSVARSELKSPEDRLVGTSVVYSLERILRDHGRLLTGRELLVLGYGKVGRGIALEARARGAHVMVHDINPVRTVMAQSDGMSTPSRSVALTRADIIVGATGAESMHISDIPGLAPTARLVSASSKDVEFAGILRHGGMATARGDDWGPDGEPVVLNRGLPINFVHRAEIGPALSLVQSGLIAGSGLLAHRRLPPGLSNLPRSVAEQLAGIWMEHFIEPNSGLVYG